MTPTDFSTIYSILHSNVAAGTLEQEHIDALIEALGARGPTMTLLASGQLADTIQVTGQAYEYEDADSATLFDSEVLLVCWPAAGGTPYMQHLRLMSGPTGVLGGPPIAVNGDAWNSNAGTAATLEFYWTTIDGTGFGYSLVNNTGAAIEYRIRYRVLGTIDVTETP
jgi:hypothetical protein